MPRSIGKYRHKITIQRDAGSRDNGGGLTSNWVTFGTVYARQFSVNGTNQNRQGQDAQVRYTVWECREYVDGVTSDMRVYWDGRAFMINAVTDETDGNQIKMFLNTIEVPAGAS